jgi:hypothetical protein
MADQDVISITHLINLYGIAVDAQRCSIEFSRPMPKPISARKRTGTI